MHCKGLTLKMYCKCKYLNYYACKFPSTFPLRSLQALVMKAIKVIERFDADQYTILSDVREFQKLITSNGTNTFGNTIFKSIWRI